MWVSVPQSRIVAEDHPDNIVEAPCVIRLSAFAFFLPLLLLSKTFSVEADTLPEVEIEEHGVEEPSARRARSSSTSHSLASVSQSIYSTD